MTGAIPTDSWSTRIRLARDFAELSTLQMAEAIGVSPRSWTNWESGKAIPRGQIAITMAIGMATGVSPEWLLHGGPMTPEGD